MTFWNPLILGMTLGLSAASLPAATLTVTSTDDSGPGSLRQAILDANAAGQAVNIRFDIPPPGPYVIRPDTVLPDITAAVVLDATTQPGFAGAPVVMLDGVNAGSGDGLTLAGPPSTVRGLVISRFEGSGLLLFMSRGHVIQGNYFGTDMTGRTNAANGEADIYLVGASDNLIGGASAAARNIIAGQSQAGVFLEGLGSRRNVISGNYIGTDVTGMAAVGSLHNGILLFQAPENVIGGTNAAARNVVSGNEQSGVYIYGAGASANVVQGNYIGTDASGLGGLSNRSDGITIWSASRNVIGGSQAGAGNLISGNGEFGVFLGGTDTASNVVAGNRIGLNADGTAGLGNTYSGIGLEGTNIVGNRLGGPAPADGNLIAANFQSGIDLSGSGVRDTLIQNNWIGVDRTGSQPLTNEFDGLTILSATGTRVIDNVIAASGLGGVFLGDIAGEPTRLHGNRIGTDATGTRKLGNRESGLAIHNCPDTQVGGAVPGMGNVVSGNGELGIYVTNSPRCVLQANYVGTDATGTRRLGNTIDGVLISDSPDLIIGGPSPDLGNLISGNGDSGLYLFGVATRRTLVQGNILGASIHGTNPIPNRLDGLTIFNASSNIVGGTGFAAGNLVSGNTDTGIFILGSQALGNVVQGNFIGTGPDGLLPVDNRLHGVQVEDASHNQIGGLGPREGNIIAYNRTNLYDGVRIRSGTGNHIVGNAIFGHFGLGIDLGPDGVTPNDNRDVDNGANNLQNHPVLSGATTVDGHTQISGMFHGQKNKSLRVDFYSSPAPNPSGFGEGRTFLDSLMIHTDGSGNASFLRGMPVAVPAGYIVTATATDPDHNTSEFSPSLTVTGADIQADLAVTAHASAGSLLHGSLLTLNVVVENLGPNSAFDVRLAQQLPPGLALVSADASAVSFFANTITFDIGTLASGAQMSCQLTLRVADYGPLHTLSSVSAGVPDSLTANNTFLTEVRVPGPQLRFQTDGAETLLAWPANARDFTLVTKPSLDTPGPWTPFPIAPTLLNDEFQVRLTPPAAPQFFRLRR